MPGIFMGCCLNKNLGTALEREKKTDKGKQQTSASFGDAALRRSNAKQFKCTLNSQRIKKHFISNRRKKKSILYQPEGVFSISRCATDLSRFHEYNFIY